MTSTLRATTRAAELADAVRTEVVQAAVLAAGTSRGAAYQSACETIVRAIAGRLGIRTMDRIVEGTLRGRIVSGAYMSWIELPHDAGNICLQHLGEIDAPIALGVFRSEEEK